MADRLTQLQDAINQQADHFTNSLGILQQTSKPTPFASLQVANAESKEPSKEKSDESEDHTGLFAQLVARTAKDIEVLIDSLPSEESSAELQAKALNKLDVDNAVALVKLEEVVVEGERVLEEVRRALHYLADEQLKIGQLTQTH